MPYVSHFNSDNNGPHFDGFSHDIITKMHVAWSNYLVCVKCCPMPITFFVAPEFMIHLQILLECVPYCIANANLSFSFAFLILSLSLFIFYRKDMQCDLICHNKNTSLCLATKVDHPLYFDATPFPCLHLGVHSPCALTSHTSNVPSYPPLSTPSYALSRKR